MAGRPKIGSEIDVANKLSRRKMAQTLRSDQAQASSFFSRGIGCSGSSQKFPKSYLILFLSPHVVAAISDVLVSGAPKAKANVTTAATPAVAKSALKIPTTSAAIAAEEAATAEAAAMTSDVIGVHSRGTEIVTSTSSVISSVISSTISSTRVRAKLTAAAAATDAAASAAASTPTTTERETTSAGLAPTVTAPTLFRDNLKNTLPTAAVVMSGLSSVLSAEQLRDADFAVKKVKESSSKWPFATSWYYPPSGPKLSFLMSNDPTKYFSIPVLLFMPVSEFRLRLKRCPCVNFGYLHKRVISNGYTEPCRVVGSDFTYAMVGNRYMCLDCKDLRRDSFTFSSYDDRVLAYLPPDIR